MTSMSVYCWWPSANTDMSNRRISLTWVNLACHPDTMNVSGSASLTGPRLPRFRVTLNARCGRACFFCRPSGEAVPTAAGTEIAVSDLLAVARAVRRHGVRGIKLTGGDPALYGPLEDAVSRLRDEAQFDEIELISRHPEIGPRARRLARNGVTQSRDRRIHRVPPSWDITPGTCLTSATTSATIRLWRAAR